MQRIIDPPETSTYERPFTREGNYLVCFVALGPLHTDNRMRMRFLSNIDVSLRLFTLAAILLQLFYIPQHGFSLLNLASYTQDFSA